jgi:hypothetical protein
MKILFVFAILSLAACSSPTVLPAPVETGTIYFALQNCQAFVTAEYVVDSVTLGTEPIVPGALSKGYTVPVGVHSAKAVVRGPSIPKGLWTFNDRLTIPANGSVTAHPSC